MVVQLQVRQPASQGLPYEAAFQNLWAWKQWITFDKGAQRFNISKYDTTG